MNRIMRKSAFAYNVHVYVNKRGTDKKSYPTLPCVVLKAEKFNTEEEENYLSSFHHFSVYRPMSRGEKV